ncbi:mitochondrial carrier domain-containing protein [Polychytrium aggregatum]|uniref:mitochondrial carrier domain-containing protein n=1 Tax=Polychytrium aggregatum TaxID=110093 RepID=UPI0022FE65DC|nr:mitochondrial carrier domain-containing protein [Polychytrium aggregatum]KAI9190830.1 mitochondrial carrier domain-containing protein [Polychytrium aggregatum]
MSAVPQPPSDAWSTFVTHAVGFSQGAIAACGAVTVTNPMEVVKTRLQLQGEHIDLKPAAPGAAPHGQPPKVYGNAFSTFMKIARTEGFSGLQKGLSPAYGYQILLNGCRLGFYEPIRNAYQETADYFTGRTERKDNQVAVMMVAGASSGILGAFVASPLFLIKTRMQSYAPSATAVGFQHNYVQQGTLRSLAIVFKNEGIRGLWRGVDAAMIRTGVGSAVQLSSYDINKKFLVRSGWFKTARDNGEANVWLHFAASAVTSFYVCLAMNPFDVAMTRMYNQKVAQDGKHGALYKNGFDCIVKMIRTEGVSALYKGFTAHYFRIGPHTILTFVFLEQVKAATRMIWN